MWSQNKRLVAALKAVKGERQPLGMLSMGQTALKPLLLPRKFQGNCLVFSLAQLLLLARLLLPDGTQSLSEMMVYGIKATFAWQPQRLASTAYDHQDTSGSCVKVPKMY